MHFYDFFRWEMGLIDNKWILLHENWNIVILLDNLKS